MSSRLRFQRIGVVGAGAWGTALAIVARRAGRDVTLWTRHADTAAALREDGRNRLYLPSMPLPTDIQATAEPDDLQRCDAVLLVTPSQHLRAILERIRASLVAGVPLLICSKGIEASSLALLGTVVAETAPGHPVGILSGPTFAAEVASGLPTAVTLAMKDQDPAPELAEALATPTFRPYITNDVVGAELGGAVKNVLAIAAGISKGRGFGANAHAALITRGLAEIGRLSDRMGGRRETLMGLSGLGDLVLTCSSEQSRNMSFGLRLGGGESAETILAGRRDVVEGVTNAAAVGALSAKIGVDMPIAATVDRILHHGADLDTAITDLLSRPLKEE